MTIASSAALRSVSASSRLVSSKRRRQKAEVAVGERVRPIEVLKRDTTPDLAASDEWCDQGREGRFPLQHLGRCPSLCVPTGEIVDQLRLACIDDDLGQGRMLH